MTRSTTKTSRNNPCNLTGELIITDGATGEVIERRFLDLGGKRKKSFKKAA